MVTIRSARLDDLEALVALLRDLFTIEADFSVNDRLQRRGLWMLLENGMGCLLVAECDGMVVGMVTGQLTVSTAEGGPALLVEDMVVSEGYRGRGIGRRLMGAMGKWAREHHVSRLQLLADRDNGPALEFYRHLGWHSTQLICLRKYEAEA